MAGEADCPFYSMQLGSCCWYSELMPELVCMYMLQHDLYIYIERERENSSISSLALGRALRHRVYYRCLFATMESWSVMMCDVTVSSRAWEVVSPATTEPHEDS